jgi:putative toxin-antitoxin system antitoxin component (TIGR02293 family)
LLVGQMHVIWWQMAIIENLDPSTFGAWSGIVTIAGEPSLDMVRLVREGLPVSAVDDYIETGALSAGELHMLVLPRKTLSNRRETGHLSPDQSDRLVRVARVIARAEETFGDKDKAHKWLRRPTAPLHGEAPLSLLDTEQGARIVENFLGRISHGIAA